MLFHTKTFLSKKKKKILPLKFSKQFKLYSIVNLLYYNYIFSVKQFSKKYRICFFSQNSSFAKKQTRRIFFCFGFWNHFWQNLSRKQPKIVTGFVTLKHLKNNVKQSEYLNKSLFIISIWNSTKTHSKSFQTHSNKFSNKTLVIYLINKIIFLKPK